MSPEKKVSSSVIKRLPRYYRYLNSLMKAGVDRISSGELSKNMGVTASQIRQDLNCFGGFGQQGYGYNVKLLLNEVSNILGISGKFKVIIIGAGNLGKALANYKNFKKRGFDVIGIFDIDPDLIGGVVNNLEIQDFNFIDNFLSVNEVEIGIICVPYTCTPEVAEKLVKLGIKGLWNFSAMDLELPYDVVVENVHLSDSLMVLGYKVRNNMIK